MAEYSATRRTPRKHKRVVMKALSSLTLTVSNSSPETCRPTNNGNPTTTNASSANCRRIGPFLTSASRSWGALCAPRYCVSAACRLRKTQYRPKADSASYRTTAIIAPACCSSITLAAAPAALRTTPVGRCSQCTNRIRFADIHHRGVLGQRAISAFATDGGNQSHLIAGQYIVDATGQADFNHRSAGRCYGRISGHMRGNGIGCFDIDLRYLAHHILNIACPRRACRRYRHISQLNVGGQNNVTPSNRAGGHHHRLGLHHGQYGFKPKQHCESHAQRSSESRKASAMRRRRNEPRAGGLINEKVTMQPW